MDLSLLVAVASALVLGLRHGFDWDHLTAIADITAGQLTRARSLVLSLAYALGHAVIVLVLGAAALTFGSAVNWGGVGDLAPKLVGLTLVTMAAWLIYLLIARTETLPGNRFTLMCALWTRLSGRQVSPADSTRGIWSCLAIGMVHAIGAETPTQLTALYAIAAAGQKFMATGMLASFVLGIVISNMVVAFLCAQGYSRVGAQPVVKRAVVLVTAVCSFFVGAAFLFDKIDWLPTISGA